jgi:hypothetical protein
MIKCLQISLLLPGKFFMSFLFADIGNKKTQILIRMDLNAGG